jgi:hypothetical protein
MDYVEEQRGDTLVIKDYWGMNEVQNSLYQAITLDTLNVPAGRVYLLPVNGYYPLVNSPTILRNTVIVGEDNTILVNNDDAGSAPPLICGAAWEGGANTGAIFFPFDLTVKNCNIIPASAKADLGWNFFDGQNANVHLNLQNCLFERTRWVFMATGAKDISWHIQDCYFVNMIGQPCRRNGGVIDVFNHQDTLLVENSTHVQAQGLIYKLRANGFNRIYYNHNTFVNCSNLIFLDLGYQTSVSNTNNIFVNCNVQPYCGKTIDVGEEDVEQKPVGLVNLLTDTTITGDRKFLVENNVIYWDSRLQGLASTLNTNQVNGSTDWVSQQITMNQRTQAMFDDDATYPYLYEGEWYEELPNFTDPQDLLTTQVDNLKTFSLSTVDTNSTAVLPDWRLVNIGPDYYIYSDWTIQIDLSYDNATLLTGATGGYPVGDLNWFPATKTQWNAQRAAEYALIDNATDQGISTTGIDDEKFGNLPVEFQLKQNYPNPFNPTTTIEYSIPNSGIVTLKVYDVLGQEVATLVDGFKNANQTHRVEFNGLKLSSGVYYYTLSTDNVTKTKKMLLLK